MDREKALKFNHDLTSYVENQEALKENELFFGMTDEEILVNKQ